MTTAQTTLTPRVGQRVLVSGGRFHGAARIEKVNPKNIIVVLESTKGRVNCARTFLSDLAEGAAVPGVYEQAFSADLPTQHPGALVTVRGLPGVYVVLADKFDKINVSALGGDRGRYWRPLRKDVTPLDVVKVAEVKALAAR